MLVKFYSHGQQDHTDPRVVWLSSSNRLMREKKEGGKTHMIARLSELLPRAFEMDSPMKKGQCCHHELSELTVNLPTRLWAFSCLLSQSRCRWWISLYWVY